MTIVEFYEKAVEGQWYDPRIKKTVQVFAITYEMTQKPNREKILITEILTDFRTQTSGKIGDHWMKYHMMI